MTAIQALTILGLATATYANPQFGGGGFGGGNFGGNNFGNNGNGNGNNNGGFSFGNGFGFGDIDFDTARAIRVAHGVLASLAFVVFFPAGAIAIRIIPGRLSFILHVLVQISAFLLYIAGFALGVWMVVKINFGPFDFLSNPSQNYHPIIGIVIFALLFLQPLLGWIHHIRFKRLRRRQFWSHAHLWLGRGVVTLGIINGGLGLDLARASRSWMVAYGVVAGIIWLIWVLAAVFGEVRRAGSQRRARETEIKDGEVGSQHSGLGTTTVETKGVGGGRKVGLMERFK